MENFEDKSNQKVCKNILYKNIKLFNQEIELWKILIIVLFLLFIFLALDNKKNLNNNLNNNVNFRIPIIKENLEIYMLKGGYFF